MADVPRPQRVRRRRRGNLNSAAPTADDTPSGIAPSYQQNGRRRRNRRNWRNRNRRRARMVPFIGPLMPNQERRLVPFLPRRVLTRRIKNELRREGLDGPKVAVQQRITSTFGLVGPNTSGNVEMELNFFTHPSLAKEANDGTAFGPLQALAAQYALWKLKFLTLRFTPMVGASAVSGSVVRASLNLSQSPGGSNWSGLGTRIHMDMHPGQVATFHLRGDQIGGPRDGGWWFTDTNEEGSQSAGPIVEIHTLGKTKSTFQSKDWDGPLFLVEGIGLWQFANYQVKPALGQLERREAEVSATLTSVANQPMELSLPEDSVVTQFMLSVEPEQLPDPTNERVPAIPNFTSGVGETIFQVVDIGAKLAANTLPIPFGWLVKGGWWFVKRLLGRRATGNRVPFLVYSSLADAQNNKPAIATVTTDSVTATTNMLVTQINSPNVGPNPAIPAARNITHQVLKPGDTFRLSSVLLSEALINVPTNPSGDPVNYTLVPVSAIPGVGRGTNGMPITLQNTSNLNQVKWIQTPWWIGPPGQAPNNSVANQNQSVLTQPSTTNGGYPQVLYRLINPRFTDQSGDIDYFEPSYEGHVQFAMMEQFNVSGDAGPADPYVPYGSVVATGLIQSGTTPQFSMTLNLIKTYKSFAGYDPGKPSLADKVKDLFLLYGDNAGRISFTFLPKNGDMNTWSLKQRSFADNTYFLAVSITNAPVQIKGVDVPTTAALGTYNRTESSLAPIFPYDLIGNMLAATSADLVLRVPKSTKVDQLLIDQLAELGIHPTKLEPVVDLGDPSDSWWPHPATSDEETDDSVSEFWDRVGGEMIPVPMRWVRDQELAAQLGIDG